MNYKQNEKLNQLINETSIIRVNIAKEFHVARAQGIKRVEIGRTIKFNNWLPGYLELESWINEIKPSENIRCVILG